jgi:hypothetical protein
VLNGYVFRSRFLQRVSKVHDSTMACGQQRLDKWRRKSLEGCAGGGRTSHFTSRSSSLTVQVLLFNDLHQLLLYNAAWMLLVHALPPETTSVRDRPSIIVCTMISLLTLYSFIQPRVSPPLSGLLFKEVRIYSVTCKELSYAETECISGPAYGLPLSRLRRRF